MSRTNPLWGAPPIHGELLTLGIDVSQATVAKYTVGRDKPASQSWHTFLANHIQQIAAADFFVPWDDVQGGAIGARTLTLRNMSDQIERVGTYGLTCALGNAADVVRSR